MHAWWLQEEQLADSCGKCAPLGVIRSLDVSDLGITCTGRAFAPGCPFGGLATLRLDGNALTTLTPLAGLSALTALWLSRSHLADAPEPHLLSFAVSAVGSESSAKDRPVLPRLQQLHLNNNGLTSLVSLRLGVLTALQALHVQGNELQRLDGLDGLTALRELVADGNKLRCNCSGSLCLSVFLSVWLLPSIPDTL